MPELILVRSTRCTATLALVSAFLLSSCVAHLSEVERYQRNRANVHLSRRAKAQLSVADVDQIARAIAQETPKQLLAIAKLSTRDFPQGVWTITVGDPKGTEHDQFGFYHVTKENGAWRITEKHNSLSPLLVGLGWDDVPE